MDASHFETFTLLDFARAGLLLLLKATLLVMLAWLVTGMMHRASAAIRHGVWSLVLAIITLLPLLSLSLPAWEVEVLPRSWSDGMESFWGSRTNFDIPREDLARAIGRTGLAQELAGASSADIREVTTLNSVDAAVSKAFTPGSLSLIALLGGIWLVGSLAMIGRLSIHVWRVQWCIRRFTGHPCRHAEQMVSSLSMEMGLHRRVRTLCSPRVEMPAISGSFRPVLLLPAEALEWTEERLRVVILHELAHVRRNDYLIQLVTEFAVSLYWLNPLIWMARRRIYTEQERAADDAVLRAGTKSLTYAEHLYDVARAFQHRQAALHNAVFMAGKADLKGRVQAILDSKLNRRPFTPQTGFILSLFVATIALPLSALRPDVPGDDFSRETTRDGSLFFGEVSGEYPVYLWMEAEEALLQAPARQDLDARASRGSYIVVPEEEGRDGTGGATFRFVVRNPGQYIIWGRVRAPEENRNSFHVKLDDRDDFVWDTPERDRAARYWTWATVRVRGLQADHVADVAFELEPGIHTLEIRNREAGTMLDGILVTDDQTYRPKGTFPARPPARPVNVWLEAEQAIIQAPLQIRYDEAASGGQFITVEEDESSTDTPPDRGRAIFRFDIPEAGVYTVWGRTLAPDDDEDSFWVRMNEGDWIKWNGIPRGKRWRWDDVHDAAYGKQVVQFELDRGPNRLEIAYREEDAQLDRLLITNDPMADPSATDLIALDSRAGSR